MGISTCSGAITLSRELENESAKFYQEFSKKFEKDKDFFLTLAKENEKFVKQIERAYYGVITDAIVGCFAFDLNPEDFQLKAAPSKDTSYYDALKEAIAIEEKILNFYGVAAEQSKHLMADVPRSFTLVAKKRKTSRVFLGMGFLFFWRNCAESLSLSFFVDGKSHLRKQFQGDSNGFSKLLTAVQMDLSCCPKVFPNVCVSGA